MQPPSESEYAILNLFQAIVEQAPDAIILADRDGAIRVWHRSAENVFGYAAAEVLGKRLDKIIPNDSGADWEGFKRAIDTGQTKYGDRVLTTRSVHKNGSKLYLDLSFGLVQETERGAVTGDVGHRPRLHCPFISRRERRPARVAELEEKENPDVEGHMP